MLELKGKFNTAKVFTDNIDTESISQIINICNQEYLKDNKIRFMPDCHAGKGAVIGTAMTIENGKVSPSVVGVDISCGMETVLIKEKDINFEKLDNIIRTFIPSGMNIRKEPHKFSKKIDLNKLKCAKHVNLNRAELSIGSLGSGNHFLELNEDNERNIYLVVHSGSRYLGKQVAEFYQEVAYKNLIDNTSEKELIINKLKKEGREQEISTELKKINPIKIDKNLAYLFGKDFDDYIHDMEIVEKFADLNRKAIINDIVEKMEFTIIDSFTTVHNYIDTKNMILRKGSVSAQKGERILIPINMADGSLICIGKGNEDWNFSAPHGAGRIMSRSKAKSLVSLDDYKEIMKNVWTTSVCESTIDESPFAYKPMNEIIKNIKDTAEIIKIIKPIYNFKAN